MSNIHQVAHRYCLVRTDGWRGYRKVGKSYGHAVVIHTQSFESEDGTHTNAVECANGMVKKELRCRGNQLASETGSTQSHPK